MKTEEQYRKQYQVYCIINNLVENERGFRYYLQDQRMLDRIRKDK